MFGFCRGRLCYNAAEGHAHAFPSLGERKAIVVLVSLFQIGNYMLRGGKKDIFLCLALRMRICDFPTFFFPLSFLKLLFEEIFTASEYIIWIARYLLFVFPSP